MGSLSMVHWLIFGIVAVLLFGNRLPSVARSLGRSFVEFKKGMGELEQEFKSSVYSEPQQRVTYSNTSSTPSYSDHNEPAAPKFEPPKQEVKSA